MDGDLCPLTVDVVLVTDKGYNDAVVIVSRGLFHHVKEGQGRSRHMQGAK